MPAKARWTWAGSLLLQSSAALLLIPGPVLHPERLVVTGTAPQAFVPLTKPKPRVVPERPARATSPAVPSMTTVVSEAHAMAAPPQIPHGIGAGDPPPMATTGFGVMETGLPAEIAMAAPGVRVGVAETAKATARGPMRVSSGVGAGMLIGAIHPVYPAIARAARVGGAVVVAAVISPEGKIERARVVSGPAMLAGAALDAIRAARYTPYRLNGSPVEVETTITVNFRMDG